MGIGSLAVALCALVGSGRNCIPGQGWYLSRIHLAVICNPRVPKPPKTLRIAGRRLRGRRVGWPWLLAWLPVPLLLAAIIAARAAGLREAYENDALRLVLSFTFYTLVSLGTLFLIGRSFLTSGSPGLLLLECGVVLWSLAGTVGDLVDHGDANINVTIFNTGILLSGLCHLAGAILSLWPQRRSRKAPVAGGGLRTGPGRAGIGHVGGAGAAGCRSSSSRARVARRYATACSSRPSPCSCSPPSCCTPASARHAPRLPPGTRWPCCCWRWGCSAS